MGLLRILSEAVLAKTARMDRDTAADSPGFETDCSQLAEELYHPLLLKHVPFYRRLDPQSQRRIRELSTEFLHGREFRFEKNYSDDRELTKLMVAAVAASMQLGTKEDLFSRLKSIDIHGSVFVHDFQGQAPTAAGMASDTCANEKAIQNWLNILESATSLILAIMDTIDRKKLSGNESYQIKRLANGIRDFEPELESFLKQQSDTELASRVSGHLKKIRSDLEPVLPLLQTTIENIISTYSNSDELGEELKNLEKLKPDQILQQTLPIMTQLIDHFDSAEKEQPGSRIHLTWSSILISVKFPSYMNVVAHELAHCIDFKYSLSGKFASPGDDPPWARQWREILSNSEDFAEACEVFFSCPSRLSDQSPEMFKAAQHLFGYTPAVVSGSVWSWLKAFLLRPKVDHAPGAQGPKINRAS